MSYLPNQPLAVLVRENTAEVEAVTIHHEGNDTFYETTLETKLGEHLTLVLDLPPQPLYDKTIDQLLDAGKCHDVVVTRIEGRGRGIGKQWTLRLRFEKSYEDTGSTAFSGPQVSVDQTDDRLTVTLTQALNIETATKLEASIRKAWPQVNTVVLHFKDVDKVVSTAMKVITELFVRLLQQSKPWLVLVGDVEKLRDALDRAGILEAFEIHKTLEDVALTRKPTIAVIDIDPTIRDQVQKIGKSVGLRVVTSPKGADAERLISDNRPVLLMLGLVLEDIDALVLTRALRQRPESSSLPIAIIADDKRSETVRSCIEAGCTDYVLTPISRDSMIRVLEKAGVSVDAAG